MLFFIWCWASWKYSREISFIPLLTAVADSITVWALRTDFSVACCASKIAFIVRRSTNRFAAIDHEIASTIHG